jgi:hypothetical protein
MNEPVVSTLFVAQKIYMELPDALREPTRAKLIVPIKEDR